MKEEELTKKSASLQTKVPDPKTPPKLGEKTKSVSITLEVEETKASTGGIEGDLFKSLNKLDPKNREKDVRINEDDLDTFIEESFKIKFSDERKKKFLKSLNE